MKHWLIAGLLTLMALPAQALVERFVEGTHYQIVGDVNAPKPEKPLVVEFFSYGCPHCEHLEPHLMAWYEKNKNNIEFERVPAQWNSYFALLGQLYLTLEKLGVAEDVSGKVFEYIHKQRKSLRTEAEVLAYAKTKLGLNPEKFKAAWESEAVAEGLQQAGDALREYRVSGVPALVVNGRYYVSVKLAGSEEGMFDVVDFLLQK